AGLGQQAPAAAADTVRSDGHEVQDDVGALAEVLADVGYRVGQRLERIRGERHFAQGEVVRKGQGELGTGVVHLLDGRLAVVISFRLGEIDRRGGGRVWCGGHDLPVCGVRRYVRSRAGSVDVRARH